MLNNGVSKGLGRVFKSDERDIKYPLRALMVGDPQALPAFQYWKTGPVLDQSATSMCVGFSARQWLTSSPVPDKGGPTPQEIYAGAQANDEWDGTNYAGTSDRGAMKWLQAQGYVSAYHWAANAEEAMAFVLTRGGALVGLDWMQGMERPDVHGVIHATGAVRGGHELFICGANRTRGLFRLCNSWGLSFGQRGKCWLSGEDLQKLLDNGGDVVAPTQVAVTP